jgi:acyl-CoA thioesterase
VSLASASAVRPMGSGTFEAEIWPGWDIMGNANGGYLLAMLARAGAEVAGKPHPVTVTGHFLAPGKPGGVAITGDRVRSGRRFSTVAATMATSERRLLAMLGTFADLDAGPEDAVVRHLSGPPDLPPPDRCVAIDPTDTFPPPFTGKVDLRLHPDDVPYAAGPTGRMVIRGWFRLPKDEPVDPYGLIVAADAFPPAIFNGDLPVAWTPTLELTVHVRARPAKGWLAATVATRFVSDGFLEEDTEIWDESGRLVAQSRQLALVPRA